MRQGIMMGWALALLALLALPSFAHGGEDHGDEPHPAPPTTTANGWSAYAVSEAYELLLKSEPPTAGRTQDLKVLLSDYATNRPVSPAKIELELSGPATVTVTAEATSAKGIYVAHVAWPQPGTYQLLATITGAAQDDLLTLDGIEVAAASGAALPTGRVSTWVWAAGGIGLLVLAGGAAWWLRSRRRGRVLAALLVSLTLPMAGSPVAQAHGGEDHGEEEEVAPAATAAPGAQAPAAPAPAAPAAAQAPLGGALTVLKETQFLLGVTTALVATRTVAPRAALLGRLVAPTQQIANLYPAQPGRIISRQVADLGQRVRRGQVLAVVEQVLSSGEQIQVAGDRLRLATEQAQLDAAIAQADRDLAKARADYNRLRSISDLVAGKTLLDARVTLGKAEDALKGLKAQRRQYARLALPTAAQARTFKVIAPIDGVVSQAHATFGETASPDTLLFQIVDARTLWVEADVYERDIARVADARQANVTLNAYPGERFSAKLVSMGSVLDPQSRTLKARFSIANPNGRLKPGMFARVAVAVGGSETRLTVPESAVADVRGRRVVFVHSAPEQFVIRDVEVGDTDAGYTAVITGVAAGDRVVTQGVYELKSQAEKGAPR